MNTDYSLLIETLNSKEELKDIKLNGTKLSYKKEIIDLKDLNFEYFLNNNPQFKEDLPNLTPESLFNIIKLHLKYAQSENIKNEDKAKKYIKDTPILQRFSITKKYNNDKDIISYIKYIDNNGITHTLENAGYIELFETYKKVMQDNSLVKTDNEIFNLLKESYKEITINDMEEPVIEPKTDDKKLLSFTEYRNFTTSSNVVNNEDKEKISSYESFLFDVIAYKDYLTPELKDIYQQWVDLYQHLCYYATVGNDNMKNTLNRYADIQDKISQIQITSKKEKNMKLERKNPDNKSTGFVSSTIYIILTITLGVLVASLLFIAS